ncbi:hypothetical protein FB567DRAFT_511256 [Paraphoma chrysanthemicola]|uniref:Heterokaryon incompatibility domain-containing protein n=1 Tax=Paraphoma chrysanthemicola TaxID=798071 RepID=A0A8K0W4I6_9PLEO|nr:hypothetical protein FB567DRAFT_511256 [Paraphoma chrysanthemicola]
MHLVYSNAQVTIIAAAGNDVTFGLPGVSRRSRLTEVTMPLGPCLLSSLPYTSNRLLRESKWMTRAWTLQEATFSWRRLIFTEEHLFLQCRRTEFSDSSRVLCERYPATRSNRTPPPKWKPNISFGADDDVEGLVRAIEQYSLRDLTYDDDVLRGLQGILSAYESRGFSHYWGVPSLNLHLRASNNQNENEKRNDIDSFVFGLCWRPKELCKRRLHFPTWSWTGWKGSVSYDWFYHKEQLMKSTDVEVSLEKKNGEHLSWVEISQSHNRSALAPVLTSFIWITAQCIPLTLNKLRHENIRNEKFCNAVATTTCGDAISWAAGIIQSQGSDDESIYAEKKKGLHTGVLLAPREVAPGGQYYPYVLIVEDKVDWVERIGFLVINGYSMGIRSEEAASDPKIIELLPWERRTIRLG